jgi:hypothetical protein
MIGVDGNKDWYLAVYFATCRFWRAPVHVHRMIAAGSSVDEGNKRLANGGVYGRRKESEVRNDVDCCVDLAHDE